MCCLHSSFKFLLKTVLSEFNLTFSNFLCLHLSFKMFDYKNIVKFNYIKKKMRNFQRQSQTEIQLTFECSFQYNFFLLKASKKNNEIIGSFDILCFNTYTKSKKEVRKKVQNGASTCLTFISTWLMCAICHQINEKRHTSKRFTLIYDQYEL